MNEKSVYETLAKVDVKPLLEKKGNLNYLSWAKAWGLVKSMYPNATYQIKEFPEYILTKEGWLATGRQLDYRQTPAGTEVEVTVTIDEQSYSSKLYVMDYRNKVISSPTYFEINKTQMRCLVKALAFAGLGLDVYAGEDLPEQPQQKQATNTPAQRPVRRQSAPSKPEKMTRDQLDDYQDQLSKYQADYNGEKKFLGVIYTKCEKEKKMGLNAKTSVPIEWWHKKLKEDSADGKAVKQFTQMVIAANKKEQAKAKIKESDGIPDYAKDPEVEKVIEEAIS